MTLLWCVNEGRRSSASCFLDGHRIELRAVDPEKDSGWHVKPARYVRLSAGYVRVGQLAANNAPHPFAPDGHTGTSCMACYGWVSDPRHAFHAPLPHSGAAQHHTDSHEGGDRP